MVEIRSHFPALKRQFKGKPLVCFDGPAGTQVPLAVMDAMSSYYATSNTNTHGQFITSLETDQMIDRCRDVVATFLGAESPDTISFGQNMTSLNFSLSHAMERIFVPGDKILVTQLDHEANRGPWLDLRRSGIVVEEVRLQRDGTLDYDDLAQKLDARTRLVAIGYASNIFGTVNDLPLVRKLCTEVNAWMLVDAVHAAPHMAIDVREIGCDFLLCSAYKFYGPHVGILYARTGLLDQLDTSRLRTQSQRAPYRIETGTLNHAALAGVEAAIHFIADLGDGDALRQRVTTAFAKIKVHENNIAQLLYDGLAALDGISIYGPEIRTVPRAPTLAFTMKGHHPKEICRLLGENGICAWDGHFYAIRATEVLGLAALGGVVRMGIVAYNTTEEANRTLDIIKSISK